MSTKLDVIIDAFASTDPEERLELLLDYASRMPPLPEEYKPLRDKGMYLFRECQSPVFIKVEVKEDTVLLRADAPPETPTPRGFISIMKEAFENGSPEAVVQAPDNILSLLQLERVLGMQRRRGLSALYSYIKTEVARQMKPTPAPDL